MKNIYKIALLLVIVFTSSCTQENYEFGEIIAPSNIKITPEIVGVDASHPYGDGSGVVHMKASADNAITYKYIYNGVEQMAPSGNLTYNFGNTGVHKYTITVIANGTGGVSSSSTFEVEVLVVYVPPADLVTMLTSNSSRVWRIKAEVDKHFGLGPIGGPFIEWYQAPANSKSNTGMYDDRFTFNRNGTFSHNTGADGTVFGRGGLIEELNGPGGVADGADIIQYPYASYTGQYSISAPNNVETITLSGLGFIGYYVGGNHKYKIVRRSANEMALVITDGNAQFDWGFVLVPE